MHRRAAILAIGVVFALAGPQWIGDGSGLDGIILVLAVEAIPFLALAAAATSMPWWLGIGAATAFGALTDSGLKSVFDSTSSTAAIAIPFIPLALLAAGPCLLAACDFTALARRVARGGKVEPPRRGEIVLAIVLAVFAFFVFGGVIGLATALAVWAHRVRPETAGS
ncbi:MAG TPA: hypothetical protein VGI72_05830 [Gaiellales bacterium]